MGKQESFAVGSANWDAGAPVRRISHLAMASVFEVIVIGRDPEYARHAAEAAFAEVDRIERELSRFIPGSDVWRINHARPGNPVPIGLATIECLRSAEKVHDETGGALDVTIGSFFASWKNPDGSAREPLPEELAAARERTGMNLLEIDEKGMTCGVSAEGVKIDFGGIGKGYAIDQMAKVLEEWSIGQALVHGGLSTVRAIGLPPGRDAWRLGMRRIPGYPEKPPPLFLRERSISGSASGMENQHIIDPRQGRPVQAHSGAWSIATSATISDALSTAFMVMSVEEVEAYCKSHSETGALLAMRGDDAIVLRQLGNWDS